MEERVRIVDIAEELGLSTATVSNVIHGKTRKISDDTDQPDGHAFHGCDGRRVAGSWHPYGKTARGWRA